MSELLVLESKGDMVWLRGNREALRFLAKKILEYAETGIENGSHLHMDFWPDELQLQGTSTLIVSLESEPAFRENQAEKQKR